MRSSSARPPCRKPSAQLCWESCSPTPSLVKRLENGELVLPLLPLPEDYLEPGIWGGLVYEDFPELTQVIHVLAFATVEALTVIEEPSDG